MLRLFFSAYTLMLLLACAGAVLAQSKAKQDDVQIRVIKDIAYRSGELSAYEKERCFVDLYLPEPCKQCPVIVWFHGGGMKEGTKNDAANVAVAERFARAGIAVAMAQYRLYPKAKYPAFIDDAAACTAWVMKHISEYGGNSKSVFIAGHSAGGYLTGILGMGPKYLAKYGVSTAQLAGMIPVSGQAFTHFVIREQHGVADPNLSTVCDDAAPCYHVRKDAPPILVIMGDNDWPARAEENRYFVAMLKLAGHPDAEYRQFSNRDHGTILGKIPEANDPVAEAIVSFVRKHTVQVESAKE